MFVFACASDFARHQPPITNGRIFRTELRLLGSIICYRFSVVYYLMT
jgi:hypothetical protein